MHSPHFVVFSSSTEGCFIFQKNALIVGRLNLFKCPKAIEVRFKSPLRLSCGRDLTYYFFSLPFMAYLKEQNLFIFEQRTLLSDEVINRTVKHHLEFSEAQQSSTSVSRCFIEFRQKTSPMGQDVFKINFDSVVRRQDSCGKIIAIARNHQLQLRDWSCKKVHAISYPFMLEFLAYHEDWLKLKALRKSTLKKTVKFLLSWLMEIRFQFRQRYTIFSIMSRHFPQPFKISHSLIFLEIIIRQFILRLPLLRG